MKDSTRKLRTNRLSTKIILMVEVVLLLSGAIFFAEWVPEGWSNAWIYSAAYNGWYMAGELVLTELVAMLIYKPLEKYITREDLNVKTAA